MSVDTLKLYERFRKTDLSEAASKEIAEAIKETNDDLIDILATKNDLASLATKEDVVALRAETSALVANLKVELIKWMIGVGIAGFTALLGLFKLLKLI
jgi:hypothetical protein